MSEENKHELKGYKKQYRQNMSQEDKQKSKESIKHQKECRKSRSIKDEKNDIDYQLFVDDGHDPLDGSPHGLR